VIIHSRGNSSVFATVMFGEISYCCTKLRKTKSSYFSFESVVIRNLVFRINRRRTRNCPRLHHARWDLFPRGIVAPRSQSSCGNPHAPVARFVAPRRTKKSPRLLTNVLRLTSQKTSVANRCEKFSEGEICPDFTEYVQNFYLEFELPTELLINSRHNVTEALGSLRVPRCNCQPFQISQRSI